MKPHITESSVANSPPRKWKPEVRPYDGPKYLALPHAIGAAIKSGELKPGDRLPSHRELSDAFGITIATTTKAVAEAARQGLVVTRKGSGTYVRDPGDLPSAHKQVDLGLNTLPGELVADLLTGALQRIARQPHSEQFFSYMPYHIDRRELATARNWLEANGVDFPVEDVIFPCGGVQQGLIAAIAALVQPGKPVLCEAWTYTGILRACSLRGGAVHGVALDSEGASPEALDRAFAETDAELFVCTPSVHNPTGRTMSDARRREIADVLRKRRAYLIEDAVNMPLSSGQIAPIASHVPERTILLSGFSKCASPGLRFAVAGVPQQLQGVFHDNLIATSWITPRLHAAVVADMIESGAMSECVSRHRSEASARQRIAAEYLGINVDRTLPGYHLWVELPPHWDVDMLVATAATQDIRLTTSSHFICPDVATPNGIRVCLGAEEDRHLLREGLQRLGMLMRGAQPLTEPVI